MVIEVEGGLDEPAELEPDQGSLALSDAGDTHARADWERSAATVLRKAGRLSENEPDDAVWGALTLATLDGIQIEPLGVPDHLVGLETSGRPGRAGVWDIRAHLDVPSAKAANEAALVELNGGVTSLWLEVEPSADFDTILDGVLLDLAPVVLEAPADPQAAAEGFLDHAGDSPLVEGTNLGADPLGARLRGRGEGDLEVVTTLAAMARDAGTLALVVDATAVHDLGASDAQELGYSMAVGAAYLRQLTMAGLGVDEAAGLMEFRYAATDEQFPTIAKLRAARRLWARVLELSGFDGLSRQRQHAVTSRPMMSRYDPWVNMLRTTVAAFAAGVGGADAVTVLPFDSALGIPDTFGRRIARNTSSLLISESHLARVVDPAGGAYAVEKLTDDLAVAGWAELGRIEEAGGVADALDGGSLGQRIDDVVDRRDAEIARRTRPLTGISEFPHLGEALPERQPHPQQSVRRYGAPFEALRDEPADGAVFLATMGPVAAHTARATFAANLFAAGGVAVETAGATDGVDQVLAAYGGQPVACLAGTDTSYAEWGAALVARLREAGVRWVIVAGKPPELDVDDSCAVGIDALQFLRRTREKLA